jgi:predicted permease
LKSNKKEDMSKFLFTFSLIILGLFFGYLIQRMVTRKIIRLPISLDQLRRILLKTALLFINPITVVGAVWVVKLADTRIVTLPLLGVSAILLGGIFAIWAARLLRLERKQTGSLFSCGSFTNIGTIGGLVCYIFLGEMGFGLVSIYKLFEEFTYYTIGFPIAKLYSADSEEKESFLSRLKRLTTDIFILVSLVSLMLGFLLNLMGVKRPEFYQTINSILIPLGALLLITSIGLVMRVSKVGEYLKECISVSIIKFLIVPTVMTSVALFLGYQSIERGFLLKVVIILSSMPVAFNALIPPSLYNLDVDLANSCWLVSTSLLIFVLPALYMIIHSF